MLSDFVDLKPGDWVIQNVANSAVGRLLIVLARQRGLRTVNVVRRAELADELEALGADIVIVDGDDLAQRVAKQTAEARIMLGRFLAKRSPEKIREIYAELAGQVMAGKLSAPVDTVYPIEKIKDALAHADKGGRNGKILVSPNGLI